MRDAQLRAGSPAGVTGVWVMDALGLPMHADGLHLLTNAQVQSTMYDAPMHVLEQAARGIGFVLKPLIPTCQVVQVPYVILNAKSNFQFSVGQPVPCH